MKVYFTASTTGKKRNRARYQKIILILREMGHDVVTTFLASREQKEFLKKDAKIVYKETKEQLKEADVVIAELGDYVFGSFGVGWRVNYALSIKKPVLCLYPKGYDTYYLSPLLKGSTSEYLTIQSYTFRSLNKFFEKYFSKLQRGQNRRVNFFITPMIDDYIKWVSYQRKISKSELIRDLLSKAMKKDEEYQKDKGGSTK